VISGQDDRLAIYEEATHIATDKMRSFMEYLERAFISESNWDIDNSYASLTSTAQGLCRHSIHQVTHADIEPNM